VSILRVALKDLEPNPYRHIENYQYDEEKIERLHASFSESGFWDGSIQVRQHPTKAGKYQLAFGHHRIEAARRAGMDSVGVIVAPRDDATMIRMMANENAEEFKHSPLVTQETIGAVIEAYGKGKIELGPIEYGGRGGPVYTAPAFADARAGRQYNLSTVAKFFNWVQRDGQPKRSCRIAFEAWHAKHDLGIDVEILQRQVQRDADAPVALTNTATEGILAAARSGEKEAKHAKASGTVVKKAAKAADAAAKDIAEKGSARSTKDRAGKVGKKAAQDVLRKSGVLINATVEPVPVLVAQTADWIRDRFVDLLEDIEERITEALPYRHQIDDAIATEFTQALLKQAQDVRDSLIWNADRWERGMKRVTPTKSNLA
jgi:ParB-like chromosome segregation protein Spo0J